ncbi:putative methyltransferase-domain-containing protein [Lipomyces kononenkoae]|uniref:Methyltransferase-domain-containing protein n=1 Tax=Lipomyces kononenkoae TaxID=34357 RepID=A0ACC3SSV1_LIPKO
MIRGQDLIALVQLYSRVSNPILSERVQWLILARALCAWQTRDWDLAEYPMLVIQNLPVSTRRGRNVEDELTMLLGNRFNGHETSIETRFLLFLAHLLRAQCLFERDKSVMARQDLAAALSCLVSYSEVSSQAIRSTFRFALNSEKDVSSLQTAVMDNLRPFVLTSLLPDAKVEIEVVNRSMNSFIELVDRSIRALDSNRSGIVFYPKPLTAMDEAGTLWGGMIFRLIPREPFPRRVLTSKCSTFTVHLALVNEMNLFPRGAILPETRIPVTADVIGSDAVNIFCTPGGPDVSDLYYPGLNFHGFYGSGKGAVTLQVNSRKEEEFYIVLYPSGCNEVPELKIIPLALGPFVVSHIGSAISDEDPLITLRPLYIDSAERIYVKESTSDLPGKIWDSALFLCDAVYNHISNRREEKLSVLDLSSGNGAVGLYVYRKLRKYLGDKFEDLRLALTDVEEAIPLIKENAANCCPEIYHEIAIDTLYWGEEKGLPYSPFDVVIACDLVYDNEYFDALLLTLERLCIPGKTTIFLGYKPRGLSSGEKSEIWNRLSATFEMKKLDIQEGIISGVSNIWSQSVGVEIWKLWR